METNLASHAREHLFTEFRRIALITREAVGDSVSTETKAVEESLQAIVEQAGKKSVRLPLLELRSMGDMSHLELDALLITAGASMDPELARTLASLHATPHNTTPNLGMIAEILRLDGPQTANLLDVFLNHGPLRQYGLFGFAEHAMEHSLPLLSTPLHCASGLISFLLGKKTVSAKIAEHATLLSTDEPIDELILDSKTRGSLRHIRDGIRNNATRRPALMHFHGRRGTGKKKAAAALCASLGVSCLHLDLKSSLLAGLEPRELTRSAVRDAFLLKSALMVSEWQCLDGIDGLNDWRPAFLKHARTLPTPVIVSSSPRGDFIFETDTPFVEMEFTQPERSSRERIWAARLNGTRLAEQLPADYLAGAFQFTPGQIHAAYDYARDRSKLLDGSVEISEPELLAGCRAVSNHNLGKLAVRVLHRFSWEDLVLPDAPLKQLRDIPGHLRYGRIVHDEWRLDLKSTGGRGMNALFSGPSGTGKTMAASIIAADLKLEMYRIDLSSIVSKYVGETEKNLARIFQEAESSNAILFFDEADSLFGKRGDVKDAHDRYANTEVNYLLQRMEEFQGITILATNLRENIDDAFSRRLHFIIEFPFPDIRERTRIWRAVFTPETPVAPDVDHEFLGRVLQVPGGNIMSIARNAAFLAAADNSSVGMFQILRAAQREYQKEGKPFLRSEFKPYGDMFNRF